jgi:hypothetical protein
VTSPDPVPPGPGVRPPYAAVPVEGRTDRFWLGIGAAGGLVAICCGLGIAAMLGVGITLLPALTEQTHRAVNDYLSARADGAWTAAYEQRCEADQRAESLAEYTRRVADQPRIESYELGETDLITLEVPAVVEYVDGTSERWRVPLSQDPQTAEFRVCGLDR